MTMYTWESFTTKDSGADASMHYRLFILQAYYVCVQVNRIQSSYSTLCDL